MVNIDTVRTDLFLVQIDDLEMDSLDVGNIYLHIFTYDNIYSLIVPRFG